MSCIDLLVWVASGVAVVPLLQVLKQLPVVGPIIEDWAMFIAPILSALAPVIAASLTPYCDRVDPLAWSVLYAALVYLVSQLTYWLSKRVVTPVGRTLGL